MCTLENKGSKRFLFSYDHRGTVLGSLNLSITVLKITFFLSLSKSPIPEQNSLLFISYLMDCMPSLHNESDKGAVKGMSSITYIEKI